VTPVEVKIGFDGIVLANAKAGPDLQLTRAQIFKALAKSLPGADGSLQPNPNQNWSDIDPSLPAEKIEVLGPPPTSGTRDAFAELVMLAGCDEAVKKADEKACTQIREDGAYIEAGENDNLVVQKLEANPAAVGIFGFSYLDQNSAQIKWASIDGVAPAFEAIASGEFPVSRSLYFYVKKEHVGQIPGIEEFVTEFTSDAAWGEDGYLAEKGLIPLPEAERAATLEAAKKMEPLTL
jgi:phosphate transport system substrate-binding protein